MSGLEGEECLTGKACYPSKVAAEGVMGFIRKKGKLKNQGTPRRAYRCDHCAWWHFTSWVSEDEWK